MADHRDGMTVKAISRAVRISEPTGYRLFQRKERPEQSSPFARISGSVQK